MLSWNSSQKLVENIFATEVVKTTTNAIVLFQLLFCRFIFVAFYSLKFRAFSISFEFIHDHSLREKDDKFIVFNPPFFVSFQFFPSLTPTNLPIKFNTFLILFEKNPQPLHSAFAHHPLALIGQPPWARKNFQVQILYINEVQYEGCNFKDVYLKSKVVSVYAWWYLVQVVRRFESLISRISIQNT